MQGRVLGPLAGLAIGFVVGAFWQHSPSRPAPGADLLADDARSKPTAAAERRTATSTSSPATPTLTVEADGTVTGHFDRVTPQWLVTALERSGVSIGQTPGDAAGDAPREGIDALPADTAAPAMRDAALQALRTGSDAERLAALTRLVHDDAAIPPRDLIDTFQSSESDRLALFAFTTYVESVAEDSGAARDAVARGLESTNAAVRDDASRRMIELERLAQVQASIAAQGLQ